MREYIEVLPFYLSIRGKKISNVRLEKKISSRFKKNYCTMLEPIQILLITDSDSEREKIVQYLNNLYSNCKVDVLPSLDLLKKRYKIGYYNLVISDFKLANEEGIEILFYIREKELDIPFIFISDSKWEEEMIDILVLNGVSDYVPKDNLKRLEFVVRREVGRSRSSGITKLRLKRNEFRFKSIVQSINGIVREVHPKSLKTVYISPQTMNILGYAPSEWVDNKYFWHEHIHPADRKNTISNFEKAIEKGGKHTLEYRIINSQGESIWIRDLLSVSKENGEAVLVDGLMIDISDEKFIENQRDLALESEKRRMKEQKCLWNITNLDEQNFTIPQLLQRSLMHLPIGFQYPSIAAASIRYGDEEYQTSNYEPSSVSITSAIPKIRMGPLSIEVVYLDEERFKDDEEAFLKEEKHLLDTILDILAIKLVKKLSTEDLKKNEQILINTYELAQLGRMI